MHLSGGRLGCRWLWLGRGWRILGSRNIHWRCIFLLCCWRFSIFSAAMLVLFARILHATGSGFVAVSADSQIQLIIWY